MKTEHELDDTGWTRWLPPVMHMYKMGCCDCGLVHNLQFKVIKVISQNPDGSFVYEEVEDESLRVIFRAQRNVRSTAQKRRRRRRL